MRYLLDSHVFLWYDDRTSPLSAGHRALLDNVEHQLYLSVASIWELTIKRASGRLHFSGSYQEAASAAEIILLPVEVQHAEGVEKLPRLHGDPFDHMLIAQARVEGMVLVTHDRQMQEYDVAVLRV